MEDSEVRLPDTGPGRRRYSLEFKRQIVLASMEPGVSTAEVAIANGMNPNQLHTWRRQFHRGEFGEVNASPALIPVELSVAAPEPLPEPTAKPSAIKIPEPTRQREGFIEVWLGEARVRVHGAVNAESLRCVIESLRT